MKVKVKICGITSYIDALGVIQLGADAIGFIFVKSSPRYITPEVARNITRRLPPFISTVGVFADVSIDEIEKVVHESGISCAQIHNDISPEELSKISVPVIKVFRVKKDFDASILQNYSVAAYLLDTYVEGKLGGTGETFDWNYAIEAKKYGRIILAGGLTPDNIVEAVKLVQPYAVDVNSGVESVPGKKDFYKVDLLFKRLKEINNKDA